MNQRAIPAQKPGRSKQDYATPRDFLELVARRFGRIVWDLAAARETSAAGIFYYGPDCTDPDGRDALTRRWHKLSSAPSDLLWLNPPYANIAPWAAKCAAESQLGARVAFLVPASVGANWYWQSVAPFARVLCLSPRLSFDGLAPYPKDLILAVYGDRPGFERWRWRAPEGSDPR